METKGVCMFHNKTYKITINLDNDAFLEDAGDEVCSILRAEISKIEFRGLRNSRLIDINGNVVGDAEHAMD